VVGAAPAAQASSNQVPASQTTASAAQPARQPAPAADADGGQTLTLWQRLRRGIFGKPQLANTPQATDPTGTL